MHVLGRTNIGIEAGSRYRRDQQLPHHWARDVWLGRSTLQFKDTFDFNPEPAIVDHTGPNLG